MDLLKNKRQKIIASALATPLVIFLLIFLGFNLCDNGLGCVVYGVPLLPGIALGNLLGINAIVSSKAVIVINFIFYMIIGALIGWFILYRKEVLEKRKQLKN